MMPYCLGLGFAMGLGHEKQEWRKERASDWYDMIVLRGVARKCVMLKPNTFFQLKLLVFHIFFSERPGEIPYLKKSR